jgi:hypothetical protein
MNDASMHQRIPILLTLALTSACGGAAATPAEEPEPVEETTEATGASAAAASPRAALERVLAAVEASDLDGLVAAVHPSLRDEVAGELAGEPEDLQRPEIRTCLRAFIEQGRPEPVPADIAARLADFGDEPTQVVVDGHSDHALLVRHEGEWFVVDTGC